MLRCDDPALALQLGVRIVGDLEELDGFPSLRVGIHTGPAAHRDGDWYGTTVNVAARLCGAAGGGEVLASEATCEAAGSLPRLRLEDVRLHWLKNVTEPVHARVVSLQPCRLERLRLKPRPSLTCRPHAQAALS
jgi:adenylate cyclase